MRLNEEIINSESSTHHILRTSTLARVKLSVDWTLHTVCKTSHLCHISVSEQLKELLSAEAVLDNVLGLLFVVQSG